MAHSEILGRSVGLDLTLDDFQKVSDKVPFLADLKPSGKYVMEDVHKVCVIINSCLVLSIHNFCERPLLEMLSPLGCMAFYI